MSDPVEVTQKSPRVPWNKGKQIGAKPPLRSKHVWSTRTRLQVEARTRDLAMSNLAIDSKLRGCDVVAIKVEDVAPHGHTADRATVRQKKTGRPVRFELTEQTWARPMHDDAPIRAPGQRVDRQHRARPVVVRHALVAADEGDADLPANRQLARRPDPARNGDILPANTWLRGGSTIGSIRAAARPC